MPEAQPWVCHCSSGEGQIWCHWPAATPVLLTPALHSHTSALAWLGLACSEGIFQSSPVPRLLSAPRQSPLGTGNRHPSSLLSGAALPRSTAPHMERMKETVPIHHSNITLLAPHPLATRKGFLLYFSVLFFGTIFSFGFSLKENCRVFLHSFSLRRGRDNAS